MRVLVLETDFSGEKDKSVCFVTVSNSTVVFIYGVSQNWWFLRSGEIIAEISLREGRDKLVTRSNAMKTEICSPAFLSA